MLEDLTSSSKPVIGAFLAGKVLKAGRVNNNKVEASVSYEIDNYGTEEYVLNNVIKAIDEVFIPEVGGIGVGVPSMVEVNQGIVYNAENIPSWRKIYLGDLLKSHFNRDVYVNNDANCFAIGEKYYGKGWKYNNMVGIVAGVGLGVGIIADNKLYSGANCGAGEFGYISYRDHNHEYYCTSGYFDIKYGMKVSTLFNRVKKQDKIAMAILEQYGIDFGNFIKTILYAVDPEFIVIGGPLASFYPYFEESMWKVIKKFPFEKTIEKLSIEVSSNFDVEIQGAAALYYDGLKKL
ncbi:ROK family protein [Marinilabiliaceae bacterium ANBcel2]|nr:ROK family protein [Marinilabiliaceae bacterium ANBcel2]